MSMPLPVKSLRPIRVTVETEAAGRLRARRATSSVDSQSKPIRSAASAKNSAIPPARSHSGFNASFESAASDFAAARAAVCAGAASAGGFSPALASGFIMGFPTSRACGEPISPFSNAIVVRKGCATISQRLWHISAGTRSTSRAAVQYTTSTGELKMYPTPRSVMINFGCEGSCSIFRRSRNTWMSIARS